VIVWIRFPTQRAGSTRTGRSRRETSVICHDSNAIAVIVIATPIRLPRTEENVSVNACCASSTSLFRRLTSAPVWVRVKNAIGICWMWAKTFVRMSKMRPSPIRAEIQRWPSDRAASTNASPARTTARPTISP